MNLENLVALMELAGFNRQERDSRRVQHAALLMMNQGKDSELIMNPRQQEGVQHLVAYAVGCLMAEQNIGVHRVSRSDMEDLARTHDVNVRYDASGWTIRVQQKPMEDV